MTLRYLLDEHLRGPLWRALQWHNGRGSYLVDVLRVGDPLDLALGTVDPEILLWAEREGRILISQDRTTLPGHLAAHLNSGHHSPGIFVLRRRSTLAQIVAFLVAAAYDSEAWEWQDQLILIP